MPLTGSQLNELDEALRDAFRDRSALARMLLFRCSRNLNDITGSGGLKAIVPELLQTAEAEGWVDGLVKGALTENPENPNLKRLYDRAWLTLDRNLPARSTLESLVSAGQDFIDVDEWLTEAQAMTRRVCRVERSNGLAIGTGFLVGPAQVITNFHVVEKSTVDPSEPLELQFRFDYLRRPNGTELGGSCVQPATSGWLLSAAKYSQADFEVTPAQLPADDELDYAVIGLQNRRGDTTGWIDISSSPGVLSPGQPMAILQHPRRRPLKLALDTQAIIGLNANRTRLHYRTNTEPGSSGSPCFNLDWKAVALHHSGDPAGPNFPPTRNAGVPLDAIYRHLGEKSALLA